MSTCPYCNESVNLADGLCEYCGAVLPTAAVSAGQSIPSPSGNTRQCPSCQLALATDDEVCMNCGAFVPVSATPLSTEKCPGCSKIRTSGMKFCSNCGYDFSNPRKHTKVLKSDEILHQKYQIQNTIGLGGQGIAYLAYDLVLERYVVIKALLREGDPDIVTQSIKEREFLAKVKHPNIVAIYDFISENQTGYIVMEYVNGETLDAIMKRQGAPLAVPDAIRYILEILPAFDYLAKLDYVYCDVKPQNIMLEARKDGQEVVKLIDLGTVMKHVSNPDHKSIYATKGYYAPEAKRHPSPETDLYSICRTLARLVTHMNMLGPAYGMPQAEEYKVFQDYPALYRLLVKGTHKEPTHRFHSAQELSDQLQRVLSQIVGGIPGVPINSRYFVLSTVAPRGKFGLLAETVLDENQKDSATSLLLNGGDQAFRSRDYAGAADAYRQILNLNTHSIDAYTRIAEVRIEEERFKEAHNLLERAKRASPYHWKINWYMGRLCEARKQYADAINYYNEVRADLPGELPPQQALARVEAQQAHYEAAIKLYNDVLKADPNNIEATLGAADAHINLEHWDEATTLLNNVPETNTRYVDAQLRICEVHLKYIRPVTVNSINIAVTAVNRLRGRSTDSRYYRMRGDAYYAARKLALEEKIPSNTMIDSTTSYDPSMLGKDAHTSYERYLHNDPHAVDREDIVRRKLEVVPWRPFIFF